ncbi:MAG: hypothetical protein KJ622_16870 [Alphaproteobacteria bacterium]|nr:hypothetical protein [Alphaproteobacteria bacterium]
MRSLSFVEMIALLFTGVAGLASAVQAYVSWDTRGEVSRAIVFAERIDACAKVLAAIEPFVAKARTEGRALVAKGQPEGRYSLPMYYYQQSSGNAAFEARHDPAIERWRMASAEFRIVSPDGENHAVDFFDRVITKEIEKGEFMNQIELLTWLETVDAKSQELVKGCRGLL